MGSLFVLSLRSLVSEDLIVPCVLLDVRAPDDKGVYLSSLQILEEHFNGLEVRVRSPPIF